MSEYEIENIDCELRQQISNVPKEWFEEGQNKNLIYKFVAYYLAFSVCVERCYKICYEAKKTDEITNTFQKIKLYVSSFGPEEVKKISDLINFDAKELEIFYKLPVFKGSNKPNEKINYRKLNLKGIDENKTQIEIYQGFVKGNNYKKIKNLLLTINEVRNNLFHGDKVPRDNRDLELIEASTYVLEKIKDFLIEDYEKCLVMSRLDNIRR